MPGSPFKVKGIMNCGNGLKMVQLEETDSPLAFDELDGYEPDMLAFFVQTAWEMCGCTEAACINCSACELMCAACDVIQHRTAKSKSQRHRQTPEVDTVFVAV